MDRKALKSMVCSPHEQGQLKFWSHYTFDLHPFVQSPRMVYNVVKYLLQKCLEPIYHHQLSTYSTRSNNAIFLNLLL